MEEKQQKQMNDQFAYYPHITVPVVLPPLLKVKLLHDINEIIQQ